MKNRHSGIDRALLKLFIFEGDSIVLTINSKGNRTLVHIQKHAEHSLSLEQTSIRCSCSIGVMPELADTEESPSEFIVTKRCPLIALLAFGDTNLQFMLGSRICDDLPVVNTLCELHITEECAEIILLLLQVDASAVDTDGQNFFLECLARRHLPHKLCYNHTDDFSL